jgi:hypothetical protein
LANIVSHTKSQLPMKTLQFFLSFILLSAGLISAQDTEREILNKYLESITIEEVTGYCEVMTSDEFEGRVSGSPGFWKTAEWLASKMKDWGIKPAGENGGYFQVFDSPYTDVKESGSISIQISGKKDAKSYSFPDDFYSGSHSFSGKVKGEAVYLGFGISAPELGYDDYEGIDVKGKILVFEPGLPVQPNHPDFDKWVYYSYHKNKFAMAMEKGAKGLLYTDKMANPNTVYLKGFVYAHIGPGIIEDLFEGTGTNYEQQRKKILEELKPQSLPLNKTVHLSAKTKHDANAKACNVIGIIEGNDPVLKNEVIIIGGHFDGQGRLGELVFPSALDNASGVANIMAAARALSQSGIKLKRSVMFLFIGGEENGLHGSNQYVENPVFPKEKTIAFFNLDMVGNGTGIGIYGGQSYPPILKHFEANNRLFVNRNLTATQVRPLVGRPRSDGAVFQKAGYTTMGIGTPGRVKDIFYHNHMDDMNALTTDVMRDVARLIFLSFIDMANDENLSPAE